MESERIAPRSGTDAPASARDFTPRVGEAPPIVVRAPGRVNLIGEHTDYHEGYVLPMAIDRSLLLQGWAQPDRRIRAHSVALRSTIEFALDETERHPERWAQYLQAAVAVMGARHPLRLGCAVLIDGDLPMGSGLSSSSALVVGFIRLLATVQGYNLGPMELAELGCAAEHRYGTTGGIMDQFVISHGQAGHALFLDCRSLEHRHVPLPDGVTVVIASTGIAHDLIQSPFAERRREAEAGLSIMQSLDPELRTLRDVAPERLEAFRPMLLAADPSGVLWRRCRHVSTENARVPAAVAALEAGDLPALGPLMAASQASLREDYEVSSPELETLVEAAVRHPGCYGARLTGGGFGGCTVNLVVSEAVADFCGTVARSYARATGIAAPVFAVRASAGATLRA
jgi:galactokinase